MSGVALVAFSQWVVFIKIIPVFLLVRRQVAVAVAERTDVIERGENGRADEVRAVLYSIHL